MNASPCPMPSAGERARAVAALILLLAAQVAGAVTLRVGPSAGRSGSSCNFASLQQAIDQLPDDGELHRIELEAVHYLGANAHADIDGRRVEIAGKYAAGSGCTVADSVAAVLSSSSSPLEGRSTWALSPSICATRSSSEADSTAH